MAQDQDQDSKTLEPTEKRLEDARRKGDVPSSRETGNMMVITSLLGVAIFALPWQGPQLSNALAALIDAAGRIPIGVGKPGLVDLGDVLQDFIFSVALALAPVFLLMIVGALFGVLIQGETVFSLERLQPKLSKISPAEGFKRLFSMSAFVEFAKNLIKVLVAGAMALWVTDKTVREVMTGTGFLPENLPGYLLDSSKILLIGMAIFLIPVAIIDILWRRYDWRKKQMMSHKEVRDEQKESEGSPELRAKRASIRRQLSRQRVAVAVPTADVILTNPTHYAVALKYEMGKDLAPICVAKGADLMAKRIRRIAFENDVPVIENKPLARLLYDQVEIDATVPVAQWEVVAEIISFVLDTRKNQKRGLPAGSSLRSLRDE